MTEIAVELTWRPLSAADSDAWVDLARAIEATDRTGEHYDAAGFDEIITDPELDPVEGTIAVFDGPTMIAYGIAWIRPTAVDVHRMHVDAAVRPDHRGRGIEAALLDRIIACCVRLHRKHHPDLPLRVSNRNHEPNTAQRDLLVAKGFEPIRWYFDMRAELDTDLPTFPVPDGLRLVPWSDDLDNAVRLASNEAFADHWGSLPMTEESWAHSRYFDKPELSSVLLAGDEVAAFLCAAHYPADEAATGRRELWAVSIATRRPWRGQGAASALLAHTMAQAKAAGYVNVLLGVDAQNPTGALGVYERCGFQVAEKWTSYDKPVDF